ncbi:nostrin [Sarotherodon galilaeus]
MSLSKKRKVDTECRIFQEKWTSSYMFTEVNGKPVCLVCMQQVSVLKEYNIRCHYETQHGEKYNSLHGELRKQKVNEMLVGLRKQQSVFTRSREVSDAAVKASYVIASQVALASKPYSEGEFVKNCMLEQSADLDSQLKRKVDTGITDVTQLAIFIRGVDDTVTEEFLELVPMTDTTTAEDIFRSVVGALDRVGADWSHAESLATDGAPSMIGKKAGVVTKFREKVQAANRGGDFWTFHCILHQEALCCKSLKMDHVMEVVIRTVNFIRGRGLNHRQFDSLLSDCNITHGLPYHTEVRWLSRGALLKRFFDLRGEIGQFMEKKGKPVKELQCPLWLQDLAFMVDITEHLNNLNRIIHAFKLKLTLWETQIASGDPAHFPCLRDVCPASVNPDVKQYKDKMIGLLREFEKRFQVFSELETGFAVFRSPFTVRASDVPVDMQLEIIDLQCDVEFKDKFASVGLDTFYKYLLPRYPKLTALAAKMLSMFGTTYLCEQVFSLMTINKTKLRSKLTHKHLNEILKLAATQDMMPDIDALVQAKRCQVSGANTEQN